MYIYTYVINKTMGNITWGTYKLGFVITKWDNPPNIGSTIGSTWNRHKQHGTCQAKKLQNISKPEIIGAS